MGLLGHDGRTGLSMTLLLRTAQASSAGARQENQDAIRIVTPAPRLAASKGHMLALADGVSQCQDGGLAARTTLQALAMDYYSTPETWSVVQALEKLLTAHNRWLRANGGGLPLLTTLTALVLRGTRYTVAHVGDCRAYLLRGGKLRKLTSDHVWEQPGMQHVLKRAMGLDEHLLMDYSEGELHEGDQFLLLSDGVWATLTEQQLEQAVSQQQSTLGCDALITQALREGSQDNVSALWVQVDQLPQANLSDALAPIDERALPPSLKAGQQFEGWEVLGKVTESRQSTIYRVRDPLKQNWLLKTLPAQRQDDEQARRELVLEEWFMRRVAGQHTPEVHPLPARRHLYYVMREHAGVTLEQHKREHGLLSVSLCQEIAVRLIRGIGLLHRRNLVHRDIKPDNLLLDEAGMVRILDFGLAYCPGLSDPERAGAPGTPSYIAPEVFAGAEPAPQQDLYSAGVALFYLMTGHYPYGEIEAFQRPRFGRPTSLSRYRPDVPAWLDDCLLKALDPDPAKRYETAEQWLLALEQGERGSLTRPALPLLEREPLLVWRSIALGAVALNVVLLFALFH